MTDEVMSLLQALTAAVFGSFVIGYAVWGLGPQLQRRRRKRVRRQERVRYQRDVSTRIPGLAEQENLFGLWLGLPALAIWIAAQWQSPLPAAAGAFVMTLLFWRWLFRQGDLPYIQSIMFTDRGAWLFPARRGVVTWKDELEIFRSWDEIDSYKIDGIDLHLCAGERTVLLLEMDPGDHELLLGLLAELGLERLEAADRVWVAGFDEAAYYQMEDGIAKMGWTVIDLFQDELDELELLPEFGVMRNMPGHRLLDEYARSWLQLNLLDSETQERRASSMFPLWQSSGTIGVLIGSREGALKERMQEWVRLVIEEVKLEREEEVVS